VARRPVFEEVGVGGWLEEQGARFFKKWVGGSQGARFLFLEFEEAGVGGWYAVCS
jgi:hypothetical protein